jgi:hypothetical protein
VSHHLEFATMIRPHSLIEGHMIVMRWVKSITSQCWASPKTHLWAAVDGVGTIEFAVVASMLATLAVGMLDLSMGLWQQMEVGNAARAGAEYVSLRGWDTSAIQTAVTGATSPSAKLRMPRCYEWCNHRDLWLDMLQWHDGRYLCDRQRAGFLFHDLALSRHEKPAHADRNRDRTDQLRLDINERIRRTSQSS